MKKIVIISGSLRAKSFNTYLAQSLKKLVPEEVHIEYADISTLPLFNQDLETALPESATTLKQHIESADGVVLVTPEYNRSIPGVLKNAIDWASRPWGKNSFAGKPVLIMGASTGSIATAIAQQDLKKVMLYLDAKVIGQPEVYVGTAQDKFNEAGELVDEHTQDILKKAISTLMTWIG